jgi:hypothetical protein
MAKIIGRKEELATLQAIQADERSAFVAIYGRRRVGKTFLIRSFYDGQFSFYLTGIANVETSNQLTNFHAALIRYFPEFEDSRPADDWFQAFQQLIKAIESLPATPEKKVLFWMNCPGWIHLTRFLFQPWSISGTVGRARERILYSLCVVPQRHG